MALEEDEHGAHLGQRIATAACQPGAGVCSLAPLCIGPGLVLVLSVYCLSVPSLSVCPFVSLCVCVCVPLERQLPTVCAAGDGPSNATVTSPTATNTDKHIHKAFIPD
jgi:hypothetical protein